MSVVASGQGTPQSSVLKHQMYMHVVNRPILLRLHKTMSLGVFMIWHLNMTGWKIPRGCTLSCDLQGVNRYQITNWLTSLTRRGTRCVWCVYVLPRSIAFIHTHTHTHTHTHRGDLLQTHTVFLPVCVCVSITVMSRVWPRGLQNEP